MTTKEIAMFFNLKPSLYAGMDQDIEIDRELDDLLSKSDPKTKESVCGVAKECFDWLFSSDDALKKSILMRSDQKFSLYPEMDQELNPVPLAVQKCFDRLKLTDRKKRNRDLDEEIGMAKRLCLPKKESFTFPETFSRLRGEDVYPAFMSYSNSNVMTSHPGLGDSFEGQKGGIFQQPSLVKDSLSQLQENIQPKSLCKKSKFEKIVLLNKGTHKPSDFGLKSIEEIVEHFEDACSLIKKLDLAKPKSTSEEDASSQNLDLAKPKNSSKIDEITPEEYEITPASIKLLSQHFKSLESLCLSGCKLQKALPYIGELENLLELDLSNSPDLKTLNGLETLSDGECSKLSCINLSNTPIENINALSVHINLKKIELQNCKQLRNANTILYLTLLSHLNINGCDALIGDIAIFKNLVYLEHLDFGKCPEISGELNDLMNLKKLRYLNVGFEDWKTSYQDNLPNLEIVISDSTPRPQKPKSIKLQKLRKTQTKKAYHKIPLKTGYALVLNKRKRF